MDKQALVKAVASITGASILEATRHVDATIAVITSTVGSEKIAVRGFGTFETKHSKARQARNPRTGESVTVPAKTGIRFRPAKELISYSNE